MAMNLPFPIFKSTGDDKRDMEVFEEDLKDYCTLNNWYDPSKSTEEERWIKTDKAIACLRACLTPSVRTVYKYSLGLSVAEQKKPHLVLQALREYYGASIGVSGERQKFLRLLQQDAESISSWESRIRNQSAQCEYESFEDELMRDQFISGLISEQLRVKLIGKGHRHKDGERAKVTLREVVEVAKTFEATTATNQLMKTARETQVYEQVNYNNNTKQKPSNRDPCFWCSGQHKQPRQRFCPAYSKRCNKCGILGHFARVCRNGGNVPGSVESRKSYVQPQQQQQYANQVEVEDNYVNEELFMTDHDMNKQQNANGRKFFAHLIVVETNRSKVIKAQIDSASTCNTIPEDILHQRFPNIKIEKTKAAIQTYGDQRIKPKGKVTFCCERKGRLHLLDFLVVDVPRGKPPLLSGRDAEILGYLDIHADEIHSVNEVKTDKNSNVHNQQIQNEQFNHQNSECNTGKLAGNILGQESVCQRTQPLSRSSKIPQLGKLTKQFVLDHYNKVFQPGRGNPLGAPMHIEMDPDIRPVHAPRRRIPVAKVQRVNEALEKLCEERVIAPVTQPTDWLSNMLIKEKPNGKLRICIDPSQTINKAIKRPIYTIPTIEENLPFLTKAKVFTIVDVSEAFHNVVLDEPSSLLTTFQGPNGRYRYLRMPFGISSGPEEYQRRQREFLEGLEGVINIADDICIFGCGDTDEQASKDHDKNLIALLDRCSEHDLRLSVKKIQFKATSVSFMGHTLTDKGVAPDPSKVIAIQKMPKPVDRNGVQRFLGMCQYLSKFCPKLSNMVLPLRDLTRINVEFIWTDVHESAFNSAKDLIASSTMLQYYDVTLPVTLQVDASDEAIGGVLLQNGKPVCFTSHTLDSTERNYAQIEKECLAIVTCMNKWHQYLYGKKNILVHTDHQPLETIFRKPLSKAPRRLQRMMLKLQQYHFSVHYKKGKEMYIADTLSRAALTNPTTMGISEEEVFRMELSSMDLKPPNLSNVTFERLKEEVSSDVTMKSLYETVLKGWPSDKALLPVDLWPYWSFRDEISVDNGVLLKSHQVIIPSSMRQEMLNKIHRAHQGADSSIRRARETLFWPGMSAAIRQTCSSCGLCAQYKSERPTEPMKSQEIPTLPWERISVDLFQLDGKTYLVTVDHYSDFIEIDWLKNTSATAVINAMKKNFARAGIPRVCVSDNGPQFSGHEYSQFASEYGFNPVKSSPYHSKGNGKAESAVKVAKNILKKARHEDPYLALLAYRNTPQQGHKFSPAQRLMNRKLRDITVSVPQQLIPHPVPSTEVVNDIMSRRVRSKQQYDKRASPHPLNTFSRNDRVFVKPNPKNKHKPWIYGEVVKDRGHRSCVVNTSVGLIQRNHKQLRKAEVTPQAFNKTNQEDVEIVSLPDETLPSLAPLPTEITEEQITAAPSPSVEKQPAPLRRSTRIRKSPVKFKDYIR